MEKQADPVVEPNASRATPGIVIRGSFGPVPQPSILAFIWGGKVRPVPQLPYGRATA